MRAATIALATLVALPPMWLAGCGGGSGGSAPPDTEAAAVRVSAETPVAAGCTGGVTGGTVYENAEVEPWLAQDPRQPGVLLAAWQQDRADDGGARAVVTAVSDNGGASWQRTLQPMSRCGGGTAANGGDYERVTDPWVDFGPDGTAYLMALGLRGPALAAGSASAVLVSRSPDGGRTWNAVQTLALDGEAIFNDKSTLTADPIDARFVYATWDRIDSAERGATVFARSTDGGATWDDAREIYRPSSAGASQTIGNRIVVVPDGPQRGTLVDVFTQIDVVDAVTSAHLALVRSTDHGATWSAPVRIADLRAVGTRDPTTGRPVRDGSILPAVAAGPGSTLWVAWQDARFTSGARDAIAISRSTDAGSTWSTPAAINGEPSVAAFTPTLHVGADGTIGLLHYDLRSDTADPVTLWADAWLLTSSDGVAWRERHVAGPFDIARAPAVSGGFFLGDYQGLGSDGATFLPLFVTATADDSNRTDVLLRRVDTSAAAAREATHASRVASPAAAEADFSARSAAAIRRAMQRPLPGASRPPEPLQ